MRIEKELEQRLNDYWKDSEDEIYSFKVNKADDIINIKCMDDLSNVNWEIEAEYSDDMAAMITNCISALYDDFINPKNRIVSGWKGYINRKVKSLNLAITKNNTEKVAKINQDMIEQYKKMNDAKFIVSEYRIFVHQFYIIKSFYEPVKEIVEC